MQHAVIEQMAADRCSVDLAEMEVAAMIDELSADLGLPSAEVLPCVLRGAVAYRRSLKLTYGRIDKKI